MDSRSFDFMRLDGNLFNDSECSNASLEAIAFVCTSLQPYSAEIRVPFWANA